MGLQTVVCDLDMRSLYLCTTPAMTRAAIMKEQWRLGCSTSASYKVVGARKSQL